MLTLPQLESTYDLLAQAIDNVPPSQRELMLAKLVLLLAQQQGDPAHFEALVRTAMEDLPAQG
jgi:hypothetical protein